MRKPTSARNGPSPLVQAAQAASVVGVMAMAATIPLLVGVETASVRAADKVEWTIDGPPCPEVARPDQGLLGRRPLKFFAYGEVQFGRRTGHVSCAAFEDDGLFARRLTRICQFTSPWVVTVNSGNQIRYFAVGLGQPATVKVDADGAVSCVLAGWFRL